jgi:hypothetical protein
MVKYIIIAFSGITYGVFVGIEVIVGVSDGVGVIVADGVLVGVDVSVGVAVLVCVGRGASGVFVDGSSVTVIVGA